MRSSICSIAALLLTLPALAANPAGDEPGVEWQWRVTPATAQAGDEVEIVLVATLAPQLILYSSDFEAELGPRPARLRLEENDSLVLVGPLVAIDSRRRTDRTFGIEYSYFAGRAEFRQKARLLKDAASVSGRIDGQTCQETDGLCTIVRQPFKIEIG